MQRTTTLALVESDAAVDGELRKARIRCAGARDDAGGEDMSAPTPEQSTSPVV